jgi:hypothetical protein
MTTTHTTSRITGKTIVLFLASAAMLGQGLRMIYQGLFQPGAVYQPGPVDILFDWTTLTVLGAMLLVIAISASLKNTRSHQKKRQISQQST